MIVSTRQTMVLRVVEDSDIPLASTGSISDIALPQGGYQNLVTPREEVYPVEEREVGRRLQLSAVDASN